MIVKNIQVPAIRIDTKKSIELYIKNKLILIQSSTLSTILYTTPTHPTKGQKFDMYF